MTEQQPLKDIQTLAVQNREQIINVIEEHISNLLLHLDGMPAPSDPLGQACKACGRREATREFKRWRDLGMSWVGQCKSALEMAKLFGVIPPEQYERLKTRAVAAITHLATQVAVHGREV